jgi:hypothetical protein
LFSLLAFCLLAFSTLGRAQTTASLSGSVADKQAAVIPGAKVTLTNQATGEMREVLTNATGLYAFPSLVPGTYTIKASAVGFTPKSIGGIDLHSGDRRSMPDFVLDIGAESQTVSVEAYEDMIPVENGQRSAVLDDKAISDLALVGRDTTELLKVLPGATTVSSGLSNGASFSDLNIGVQNSAVGMGININGAVNRGGTALLADGASIIDPGNMAQSLSVINPNMTQEVTVQASNFGADVANGPVVVSAISKSGSRNFHGQAYFDARNNVLNANDWQDNHNNVSQGPASYYYPGGNVGGPVPFTHKKLFFCGGLELWRQNLGNSNHLSSYIPTPEMMAGNFSSDNANNMALCPTGFSTSAKGTYCADITKDGTLLPDGSTPTAVAGASGGKISSAFLDPGSAALAKIWPKANFDPSKAAQGYNYYQPIPGLNNGWIWRVRGDYNLGDNTKIYVSYQKAHNSMLAQGNGAHLYWTPGNAIPFPGGGEQQVFDGQVLAGHMVHNFGSSATNDLMGAWSYGSFPFTEPDPSAATRKTLQYPASYGKVFGGSSVNIPAYSSAGNYTFPDFSQASIFANPVGKYAVSKSAPQFSDTFTKIWGAHTVKLGGYWQNTDNYQSTMSSYIDGNLSSFSGQNSNFFTHSFMGSLQNPTANFVMGVVSGYSEHDSAPIADTAQQTTAFFVDDTWKVNHRLTVDYGARFEHVSHWYDRDGIGMAVFKPTLVDADANAGKYAPGFRWHAIDSSIPTSGQPNPLFFFSPRLGVSYDLFGNGNTIVRGGWGAYRFVTQVNDVSNPLVTAQHMRGYSLPGGNSVRLSEIGNLANQVSNSCIYPCYSASQWGFDPNDKSQPRTYAYNLTIDQRLKWHTQLDIGYVGSSTSQIPDASQGIEGSTFSALADQNKTPIGAFFNPDPVTGKMSNNPEDIQHNLDGTVNGNKPADYHPFSRAYGPNAVYMVQGISYTNYNGLQVVWAKTAGKLTYNFNAAWSKTLGTGLQANPFDIHRNYGPVATDRPFVFNASYMYQTGKIHSGNQLLNYLGSDWSISGISTWQQGGNIPTLLGNGVPNFGMNLTYVNLPDKVLHPETAGVKSTIGSATYFGTDASLPIQPVLTCNPTSELGKNQRIKSNCFSAPKVGSQGGQAYPYMSMGAYFNNDLALFRSFVLHEAQNVQFRISAANWLNHPLMQFSSQNQVNLFYNVDYNSKAITLNQCSVKTGCKATQPDFGTMDTKTAAPNQRIITLSVKYSF